MLNLKENVAASATFQTWIGATGDAAAKLAAARLRIYEIAVSTPTRPFAIIELGPEYNAQRNGHGTCDAFIHSGGLFLVFEALATDADDKAALKAFTLIVDAVIDELLIFSGQGGYLAIENLSLDEGPEFVELDQEERIIQVKYKINWK